MKSSSRLSLFLKSTTTLYCLFNFSIITVILQESRPKKVCVRLDKTYDLKAMLNSVLKLFKVATVRAEECSIHAAGPAYEKDRSPNFVSSRGMA